MTVHDLNVYFSRQVSGAEQNYAENNELALMLLAAEYVHAVLEIFLEGSVMVWHVTIKENGKEWIAKEHRLAHAICRALWEYKER
jgi:hypothetical protein